VPLDAVADLVDEAPLRAAALTVNDDETHVAVRLGFHTGALDAAGWTDFLEGDIAQPETPSDLGIIVDKEVFVDLFKGFVNPAEISKVNSDGPPTAYWWPLGDTGVMVNVITPIEVEVPVCPDIDGDIFTDFLVNFDDANDEMVVDAFFDYDLSEWDKFACSALSTFFDPFNAAVMGGIINGLAGVFAPDAGELQAGGKVPSECQVTGEKSFQCKFPVSLPDIRFSGVGGPRMGDILPRQSRGHPGDPLKAGLTGTLRVPCAALQAADGSIELQLILPAVLGLLMLDVLLDDFFVSTHCRNEVAARPEVLPAEVPPNRAELSSDLDRALPLDIPIACATECFGGIEIMM
jgi:hypothetical protein